MNLGEKLKHYRAAKGMTQQEVADILGVDKSTYAHYEAGKRIPNAKAWVEITRVLQLPVFPAEIGVVYPEGMLDEFEDLLIQIEKTVSKNYNENLVRGNRLSDALRVVMDFRSESISTSALPVENLLDYPMPQTVANLTLDIRGEELIKRAIRAYDAILRDCGFTK